MAGNIIPAIATTNAIVAGMVVVEAAKIISGDFDKLRVVFINRAPNPRGKVGIVILWSQSDIFNKIVEEFPDPRRPGAVPAEPKMFRVLRQTCVLYSSEFVTDDGQSF